MRTGESVSVLEMAETIREVTGADSEIVHVEPREADVERSRADVAKVERGLGYEARVGLGEGLAELVERTL